MIQQDTKTKSILNGVVKPLYIFGEMFTEILRMIIYARVSTDEQAESGTSIKNQIDKSLDYLRVLSTNRKIQIQVIAIFEEDYTGKVLDRPELNKVREIFQTGQADGLTVYKTNRLVRDEWGINLLLLMKELKELDIELHYSKDKRHVDLHNPMEAFMFGSFAGWQAGEDHKETVEKLHEGRINRAKEGYVVPHGNAPYGYDAIKKAKKWYFVINESEAVIVELIFQWYVIGDENGTKLSQGKIADKLNQMGITAKKGGQWRRAGIGKILEDETYAGTWHYGKRPGRKVYRPKKECIPVPVPAIVEREIWEAAQKQLEHNKQHAKRNRKPGRYLLSGRLTCGCCHYGMFGVTKNNPTKTYKHYICRNRHMPKREQYADCNNVMFDVETVDTKVWQWIEEIASDKDRLLENLEDYQAQQESESAPLRQELALVESLQLEKEKELEEEQENFNILTSKRAKAKKAADIEQIEIVLDELEKRYQTLTDEIGKKELTPEEVKGISDFVLQVSNDLAILKQAEIEGQDKPELKLAVYEAKQKLLDILDVQVMLFTEDGNKKAKVTAKFCAKGYVLSVEKGSACITILNRHDSITIGKIIEL